MSFLKNKKVLKMIGFTALFLLVYRFGVLIHLPFIDREFIKSQALSFGFLEVFTGGALSNFSILSLGISPYITASIVIQLLQMDIIPVLKEWAEEGEVGRQKINQLTRYVALGLAFVQSLTLTLGLSQGANKAIFIPNDLGPFVYFYLAIVSTAGTAFTLWLAEQITVKGIGNGTSMIIVAGILASFPQMFYNLYLQFFKSGGPVTVGGVFTFIAVILVFILIIVGVTFMEAAQRKIPIQYANRPAAAALRGKTESNIPIKLNSASVIPVIFASTLMSLPITIINFFPNASISNTLNTIFNYTQPIGFVIYILLIFVFSFFYSFLQMNPDKISDNLQNQNAYIPGIRPGADTASYLSRVLFKITMVGATYLSVLAALPIILQRVFNLSSAVQIGGTSLIIVVGVAVETAKQLKTETQEKQYRGFI